MENKDIKIQAIRDPPINTHYRQCSFDIEDNLVPYVIGHKGRHFINITRISKVKYIWYNNKNKLIEIWGPEYYLNNAEMLIKEHIMHIRSLKHEELKKNLLDTY